MIRRLLICNCGNKDDEDVESINAPFPPCSANCGRMMRIHPDFRCDECEKPATLFVRDIEDDTPDGSEYKQYKTRGEVRKGCDDHPVHAVEYGKDGRIAGRLADDEGRPIPR